VLIIPIHEAMKYKENREDFHAEERKDAVGCRRMP
jgi:hypothetical protein